MSLRSIVSRRRAGAAVAFAIVSTLSTSAFAADITKLDDTLGLEAGAAWGGGAVPTVADVALFNSTLATNSAWTLGTAQTWGGLRLTNPANSITINGTAALTLGAFGVNMSGATQNLTINTPVNINGGAGVYNWNVASGHSLTLATAPVKAGHSANHTGIVKFSTTGTIKIGAAASPLLISNANNPYATYGTDDWAALDASGNVVAATYTNSSSAITAGTNLNVDSDIAGPTAVDFASVRFNDPTPRTMVISTSATSRTATLRGILVGANSGGATITNTGVGLTNNNGFIRPNRTTVANTAFPVINNSVNDLVVGAQFGNGSSGAAVQIVKYGVGKLVMTATNSYTGGTLIGEGTVEVGGDNGTPSTGAIVNNGALILNRNSGTLTLNQVISGAGSIEFKGAGTYVLGGANTYSAANNINGGIVEGAVAGSLGTSNTININGGGYRYNAAYLPDLSSFTHTVGASGAIIDTNGQTVAFANNFGSGSAGGLTKRGAGTLTLNGASNYNGATTINGGTLVINGAVNGAVTAAANTGVGGNGSIGGLLSVASGATVSPGASVGTLTTNGLTLDAGSLLNIEFGTGVNDKINAGSGVTINGGALSLFQQNTTTPFSVVGMYDIIQHSGAIGGSGISSLSVANQQPGFLYTFSDVGGFVKLNIQQNGVVSGWLTNANGSWGTAGNWSGNSIPNNAGDAAQFTTALTSPITVTLDGNRTVGGVSFNSANGYTIAAGSGGTLTLNGNLVPTAQLNANAGSHTVAVPVNMTATTVQSEIASGAQITVSGQVTGSSALTKNGAGTLVLSHTNNTYAGATTVNGGTLQVGSIGSLGSNATLNLNGGGVIKYASGMTTDLSTAKTVTLGTGGGGIDTNGNDVTFATSIPGTGGLVKAGAGKLTLATTNSYTGATSVRGGVLSISSNDQLGDQTVGAGLTLDGGALEATGTFSLTDGTTPRALTVGTGGGTISVADTQTLTLPGNSTGSGTLTKVGTGTLELSGAGNRSGVTSMESGFLTLTNVAALGSGRVDLVGGAITLNGQRLNNTLNVIGAGGLNGGSGGGLADLTTVTGNGHLTLNITTGVFDLEGDMTAYTGTIDVQNAGAGGLRLNGSTLGSNLTLNIGTGVTVMRRGTTTVHNIGALTGQGTLAAVTATTGNTTYTIGGKNIDATFDGFIGDTFDSATGALVAQTLITKVGTGTQTFNGENYYSGLTTVQGGTLQLGPNAQTPILGGNTPLTNFPVTAGGADIQNGKLVYDYTGGSSPAGTIVPLLATGYNTDGNLTGTIRSSTATSLRGLGYIDDTANSKFIIGAALYGDTNLNGSVTFDDLLLVAQHYGPSTGKTWSEGDFTYNGIVDFDDLLKVAQNYGGSLAMATDFAGTQGATFSGDWALALSTVPEPTTLGLLGGLATIATRRRRD